VHFVQTVLTALAVKIVSVQMGRASVKQDLKK